MQYLYKMLLLLVVSASLHAEVLNNKVTKVFGASSIMNYLIYSLNSDKMIAINNNPKESYNFIINEKVLNLPVIGSFYAGGANIEIILNYNPDFILLWEDHPMLVRTQNELAKINIPTLTFPFIEMYDMPSTILKVGIAIDEEERGRLLSSYAKNLLDEIQKSLKNVKKVRYYYAEGNDGLSTECDVSFHVKAINFAGANNVHKCRPSSIMGLERITFETLIAYNPDVIVAQNMLAYNHITKTPIFQHLKAVKDKKVYVVPDKPFNWIDRPPSLMRLLGTQWLANKFHPEAYNIDINKRTHEFFELFFRVDLSAEQIDSVLGQNK